MTISGLSLATAAAGIRYQGRDDLLLMQMLPGASTAAVFTQNAFCAAPVMVAKAHLAKANPRALLINSGNANAGTGEAGLQACQQSCELAAEALGINPEQVLPFSTGVIGELLPVGPFEKSLPSMASQLNEDAWQAAAAAIMTTDTRPKLTSRQVSLPGGESVSITGTAKGSGMIHPNMATMLAFVATDANIPAEQLQGCLEQAVADSFNAITVDGDTSTNDACVLVATGASGSSLSADGQETFQSELNALCEELALAIVRDGEGATKCVEITVTEARSRDEARTVAFTVAHSPLVKTALFASDANWGRILAAVGRAPIPELSVERCGIWINDLPLISKGEPDPDYTEAKGAAEFAKADIALRISLGRGDQQGRVWTTDLSHEYVRINAEYRS